MNIFDQLVSIKKEKIFSPQKQELKTHKQKLIRSKSPNSNSALTLLIDNKVPVINQKTSSKSITEFKHKQNSNSFLKSISPNKT